MLILELVLSFPVCLGIAVDDTIHFLSHYKEMVKSGLSPIKSLEKVFIHTGPALVFTTFILTICFGCFIFANFVPNINFGVLCSIILTMALVIDLVYLPAILLEFKVRKVGYKSKGTSYSAASSSTRLLKNFSENKTPTTGEFT